MYIVRESLDYFLSYYVTSKSIIFYVKFTTSQIQMRPTYNPCETLSNK